MFYVLDGHTPVEQRDNMAWLEWYMTADRQVAKTQLPGDVEVSTVFLGVNHDFLSTDDPLLFETMIFGGAHDKYIVRCSTWEQAEQQHKAAVELAKSGTAA